MSAFDDWVDDLNESRPNRQSFSTGPVMVWMRMAFDAGLEAAAKQCLHHYLAKDALEAIRELKEES